MTEPFKKSIDGLYRIERWEKELPGLTAGFTSKNEGSGIFHGLNMAFHVHDDPSAVRQNRMRIGEKTGIPVRQWVGCEQTHGTHIEQVSKEDSGRGALDYDSALSSTDGLYTNDLGILLTLCYADCVPLYFETDRQKELVRHMQAGKDLSEALAPR